jgi:site-specific DNA recombinase
MQVVGYVRVSTVDQASEGVSLEAQRARIETWCGVNGATLAGRIHVDAGISGKRSDNRPELLAALDEVCGLGGVLVVYSLSRLARSTRDTLAIAERLERAGADLVSLSEKIDTTSAAGKMIFRVLAVLAEFERDVIAERTTGAMRYKKSKGERVGQIPYGKTLADDGRTLLDAPAELEALTLIRTARDDGRSLRRIAQLLTDHGIPTKNGGKAWSHTAVAEILNRDGHHATHPASEGPRHDAA